MKYAIMSDAHANPAALKTALADARRLRCGRFLFLGDATGYGYDAKGAVDLIRENFDVVLKGNHDSVCAGGESKTAVAACRNYDIDISQRTELTADDIRWLGALGNLHEEKDMIFAHDNFIDPSTWWYILSPADAAQNFCVCDRRLMFCGHTHHAAVWEIDPRNRISMLKIDDLNAPIAEPITMRFPLRRSRRYIVNVGSVGYPRTDRCIVYAVYDSIFRRIILRALPFDFAACSEAFTRKGMTPPPWLVGSGKDIGKV